MSDYVVDAGPLIAFLNGEDGSDVVEDKLTGPGSTCYTHVYNLCEVYYVFYRAGGAILAEEAIQDLLDIGIMPRDDIDTTFWKEAGSFKGRHPLSLPDAFCLALAKRIGATLITTDRSEFGPISGQGYCDILFIR